MKVGKKKAGNSNMEVGSVSRTPKLNQSKKTGSILVVVAITIGLIAWVISIGNKAEATVAVVQLKEGVYKNQVLTADDVEQYDMLQGEFEKYAIKNDDGTYSRRLVLWDEIGNILGSNPFAAYPLQGGTLLEYRSILSSRIDNSDSVLYSYPGKDIVKLDIGSTDLSTFKTFLQPGDRLNVEALYSDKVTVRVKDAYGVESEEEQEVFRTETVFGSIMIADLLNSNGESVLDIYTNYNDLTVTEQAALDSDSDFQESVEPASLLVALTPEEKERYYYYKSKKDVEFTLSLPQRAN